MEKSIIEQVIIDQLVELKEKREERFCTRNEEALIDFDSKLAQVIIGVRRCGKSTLCFNALEHAGIKYAYFNFDDDRLAQMSLTDMDSMLELLYKHYGDVKYLFLDEIQNIEGWHLFANRMLRSHTHLIITGSNSKLLSGELASHLTGRHHEIELLPFSFSDYCKMLAISTSPLTTKNRGLLQDAFDRYLRQGGFPELLAEKDAKSYIGTLVKNIIQQDIKRRYNIRHTDTILRLTTHLLNEAPAYIVKDTLMKLFEFNSAHTLGNYLSYLSQTYLLSSISKYSTRSRQRVRNEKGYAIDVAMMNYRENAFAGDNLGHRLETIVYIELKRRAHQNGHDIYYYSEKQSECDFVVCEGRRALAVYQVCYDLSSPKTRRRELRGCIAGAKATACTHIYLITYRDREEIEEQGYKITVLPAYEWLLT